MAVNLSPVGGVAAQFFTNTGAVLTGGKLYTYAAGTTTPQTTFTSSNGGTAWTNPIVLDAAGRVPSGGEIWLTDGINYKFVLKDSNDVLIATYDNVSGINSNFISFTNQQQIVTATANQTVFNLSISYQPGTNSLSVFVDGVNQYGPGAQYAYIETDSDTVTFVSGLHVGAEVKFTTTQQQGAGAINASQVTYNPAGTGAVATNVQAKLREYVSIKDFGAVGNGVADDTAAIQAAINASNNVFVPPGTYKVTSTLIIPDDDTIVTNGFNFYGASTETSIIVGSNTFNVFDNNGTYGTRIRFADLQIKAIGASAITHTVGFAGSSPTYNVDTTTAGSVTPPVTVYAAIKLGIALNCEIERVVITGFSAGVFIQGGYGTRITLMRCDKVFYGVYMLDEVSPNFKNLSHVFEGNLITNAIYGFYLTAPINHISIGNICEATLTSHYIINAAQCDFNHDHIEVSNNGLEFVGVFTTNYNQVRGLYYSTNGVNFKALTALIPSTILTDGLPIVNSNGNIGSTQQQINNNSALMQSATFSKSNPSYYEFMIPLTSGVGTANITFNAFVVAIADPLYGLCATIDVVNNAGTGGQHQFASDNGVNAFSGGTGYVSHTWTNTFGVEWVLSITVQDGANSSFMMAKVTLAIEGGAAGVTLLNPVPLSQPFTLPQ
jgi:hypothetical protein